MTTYRLRIQPLTSLHIGTGEVVNPGEYFVFDNMAYFVDLGAIAAKLTASSRDQLLRKMDTPTWVSDLCDTKGFPEIIKRRARFSASLGEDTSDITEKWGKGSTALAVALLPRAITGVYLPGSSIKGALRTALLAESFQVDSPPPQNDRDLAGWERMSMGAQMVKGAYPIEVDPLRNLRVSDAILGSEITTEIHRVSREGMAADGSDAELQDYRECFPGAFFIEKRYDILGSLTIGKPYHARANPLLTREALLAACNRFYLNALQADVRYWQARDSDMAGLCAAIRDEAQEEPEQWALIRLGWGCGRDAMSLNQLRPEPLITKTRALVDGYVAGWALLALDE